MFICKRNNSFILSAFDLNIINVTNKLHNLKNANGTFINKKTSMRIKSFAKKVEEKLPKIKMGDFNRKKSNKLFSKAELGHATDANRSTGSSSFPGVSNLQRGTDRRSKDKESIERHTNVNKEMKSTETQTSNKSKATGKSSNKVYNNNIDSLYLNTQNQPPCFSSNHVYNPYANVQQAFCFPNLFAQSVHLTSVQSSHTYYRSVSDSRVTHQNLSNVCFNSSQKDGGTRGKNVQTNRSNSSPRKSAVSRSWELTSLGKILEKKATGGSKPGVTFKIMSYNVLAQDLLQDHPELYKNNDKKALEWKQRWRNLLQEIKQHDCEILCLQEVQHDHIEHYFNILKTLGYNGIYKQRTGIRSDGCAIYYKKNIFKLVESNSVEYKQNIASLDRDNVALIAKLAVKSKPSAEFVIATTHLLYNPRRQDVRLAQTQLLLTEIDRIAYQSQTNIRQYLPVIITGDFNSTPDTAVYDFLANGKIQYENVKLRGNGPVVGKHLISPSLRITDDCQHADLIELRKSKIKVSRSDEHKLIMLQSSERSSGKRANILKDDENLFSTGSLSHDLALKSVYNHRLGRHTEGTTFQDEWITVDYIFYSGIKDDNRTIRDDKLKLLSRYTLPTSHELNYVRIPNFELGSDHLSLLAKFKFEYD